MLPRVQPANEKPFLFRCHKQLFMAWIESALSDRNAFFCIDVRRKSQEERRQQATGHVCAQLARNSMPAQVKVEVDWLT